VAIASYILPSERPISRAQVQWRDDRDASQPSREQVSYARCIPWVGEGRWQAARDVAGQRNAQHHSRERRLRPDARDAGSPRPAVTEPAIVPRVRARSNMRVADRRSPVRRCTEVLTACPWSDSLACRHFRNHPSAASRRRISNAVASTCTPMHADSGRLNDLAGRAIDKPRPAIKRVVPRPVNHGEPSACSACI
jgi:hypothetical protein